MSPAISNRRVLVTGASVGIGSELARLFARDGFELVLVARNAEQLERVAAECRTLGAAAVSMVAKDLSLPAAGREIFAAVHDDQHSLDVLVNNAGFGTHGTFAQTDLTTQLNMLHVNVVALTELTGLFLPEMLRHGSGRILNVASTAAFQPGPLMAVYYASKAYVLSFSEALDSELARTGVTVTALCPGPTATEFQKRARMKDVRLFKDRSAMSAAAVAAAGYRAMMKGQRVVVPGMSNKLLATGTRFVPRALTTAIAKRMNKPL